MSAPAVPQGPADAAPTAPTFGRAQSVVRRIIVFVILFALVVIAANGLSGLIERVIGAGTVIAGNDTGLAISLAFALIGGPLVAVLWWWERRRLIADPSERASLVWALYVTAMSFTALIVATTALGSAATAGVDGEWSPGELSTGIVWRGRVGVAPAHAPQRGDGAHAARRCAGRDRGRCTASRSPPSARSPRWAC